MDVTSGNVCSLRDNLKAFLDSENYTELKSTIQSTEHRDEIYSHCDYVIPIFAERLNEDTWKNNYELFECCESLIYQLAELSDPESALLEFIEWAEKHDEELFLVMLRAMKISLLKVIDKNASALSWCLNTIIRHINDMEQVEDFKLEGDEYVILENADSSQKTIVLYKEIFKFLEPVLLNVLSKSGSPDGDAQNSTLLFFIKLLGRPLVYMQLSYTEVKGDFRLLAEDIMREIVKFKLDLTHFLNFVIPYNPCRKTSVSDVVDLDFNNISLGVLYYLIFTEGLFIDNISHVYHLLFLLQTLTTLALDMLVVDHSSVQNKGLLLFESSLRKITDFYLDLDIINCELFGKASERLSQIIIYSDVRENRIVAVRVFKMLLEKFNSKGRYYILYNLQNMESHSNFIGYIITITKDFVISALKNQNEMDLEYFTGKNLCNILSKFCFLHKGAESDLNELADRIIAALNFLRFLLIRDTDNSLGLTEFIPQLEKDFVTPLKTGLSLSAAHYKLQKTELTSAAPNENVNVTVGGLTLPALSNEQKVDLIDSALNTFDLIEALVARVEECLEEFKHKHSLS